MPNPEELNNFGTSLMPQQEETLKLPGLETQDISSIVSDIRSTIPNPTEPTNVNFIQGTSERQSSLNSLFSPQSNQASFYNEGFTVGEAYTRLNSGDYIAKFDNFLQGVDNEERFAQAQTTSDKWVNGWTKFLGKTGTAVLGGTIGTLYGVGKGIFTADWSAVWDNEFQQVLDDWNTQMDYKLPNYYTQEEKKEGFFGSLNNANFWANDFLGGLSFTVGAIATEAIWAAATGGASLTTTAARLGLRSASVGKNLKLLSAPMRNYLSKFNGVNRAKNLGRVAQGANTLRYFTTSAGYEAGVEARHYMNEQRDFFYGQFEELNGRKPTSEEIAEFEANLQSTANTVFATNLAIVGSSNLAIFGKMFNINSPLKIPKSKISKYLFGNGIEIAEDGTKRAIKRNLSQRIVGGTYSALRAPIIEGVYEEGLQSVTSTAAASYLQSSYTDNKNTLDLIESVYEGLSHTYGTKEGFKEVGLGMLIGMFGGGISSVGTGRNPFSPIIDAASTESSAAKNKAEILNSYSAKKLVNGIFRANVINKAVELQDQADARGDIFGRESARTMGALSSIIYGERLDYGNELENEFATEVSNYNTEELAEKFGITVEEAQEMKTNAIEDYKQLRSSFVKNRDFANYVIGKGRIDKDNSINVEEARDMIAYQMTMAERAESISDDFVRAIMTEVGDSNTQSTKLKNTIEVEAALRRATKQDRDNFNTLKKEHRAKQRELEALEKKRRTQERLANSNREDNKNIAGQLNQTTQDINSLQEELLNVENRLEQAYSALSIYTVSADSDGIISGKELAQLDKNIQEFEKYLNSVEQRDKSKSARLQKYLEEYRKSIEGSKQFSEVIEDLLNPETGLKGSTRTFLNKLKEYNAPTERLVNNLKSALQTFSEGQAEIFVDDVTVEDTLGTETVEEDDIVEDINASGVTEVDGEVVQTPRTATDIDTTIKELIESNDYALQNFGYDVDSKKPTQTEIDRYQELLSKLNVDPDTLISQSVDTIVQRGTKKVGLSREEIEEFKSLTDKLSDWQVLDGISNETVSITDLIEQKLALNTPVVTRDLEVLDTNDDIEIAIGPKKSTPNVEMSGEMVNTPDTVMVQKRGSKLHLTHLKVKSIVDRGATLKKNGNTIEDYTNLQKGIYTFDFGQDSVSFKLTGHKRMEFSEEEFQKLLNNTELVVISTENVKGTSWSPVYERTEDGNYKPLGTDYDITLLGSEYNILDPQKLYDMRPGDEIFFKVSLKDSFNAEFEPRYIDVVEAYENSPSKENKQKLLDIQNEIYQQSSIYIVNGNNDVVGQLKAALEDVQQTEDFKAIRKYAGNLLIENYDPNKARVEFPDDVSLNVGDFVEGVSRTEFTLPFTTKVTGLFIGTPNMNVSIEEGSVSPAKVDFNEKTIEMVQSYGIIDNGQIILNENEKISLKDVNKQFVQNLGKTVPIAIINYRNQKIAYPISLKEGKSALLSQIDEIIRSNQGTSKQVVALSKLLANNGIDPKKYNVTYINSDNNFFTSPNFDRLLNDLENLTEAVSREEILSKNFKKSNLLDIAQISINLENNPFQSPKIQIDLKTPIRYNEEAQREEEAYFDATGKVSKYRLDVIANELLSKKYEQISPFYQKVVSSYRKEIEKIIGKKIELPPKRKQQSKEELDKRCNE